MIDYEKPLDDFIIDVIVKNAYSNNLSLFNGCCADIIVLNEAAKIFNNSNLNSLLDERIRFLKMAWAQPHSTKQALPLVGCLI